MDKTEEETRASFAKHFIGEFAVYHSPIHAISLVDKAGREKIISDAYFNQCLEFDHPDLCYTAFDFHEYCRGMHFENVSILLDAISEQVGIPCRSG